MPKFLIQSLSFGLCLCSAVFALCSSGNNSMRVGSRDANVRVVQDSNIADKNFENTNYEVVKKMYADIKSKFKDVPEIEIASIDSPQRLTDFVIVDVRPKNERAISIIPGALSMQEFEKAERADREIFVGRKIVAYCTIGYRSAQFVQKLMRRKLDAYNLKESLLGWVHSGKNVVSPDGKVVRQVHVYGPAWNYLPEAYKGIW